MKVTARTGLFLLLILGLADLVQAQPRTQGAQPLFEQGMPVKEATGVWRSRGYGWILSLGQDGVQLYHESRAGCSRDPRTDQFRDQFAYRLPSKGRNQLVAVTYPGENRYVFDRLARLPNACAQTDWTPQRLFDHFAASYGEQYAFFPARRMDWEARVRKHRPLIDSSTSPRVLFAVFSDMLDGLEDAHVGMNAILSGEATRFRTGRGRTFQRLYEIAEAKRAPIEEVRGAWVSDYERGIHDTILAGRGKRSPDGRLVWGHAAPDVGYLHISAVEGFAPGPLEPNIVALNALMDRILTDLSGVKAIIVDLSFNRGGYDRLSREIAGRFAARRALAYTKKPLGAEDIVDEFFVEPSAGRRFTGPVYLVTSDYTVSGGEILTMAMRALPNVTHVGMPTRGALSDRLTKVLPNGWDFSISNEIYLDPNGTSFEGPGVPPERELEVFPLDDLSGGHAKALAALVKEISRSPAPGSG